MPSIPFAFSVHHFISTVGADAGFASIIGLAILVLLYFAHARETANLREQAYESAHRVQQLEAQLAQLVRRQPTGGAPTVTPPPAAARRPPSAAPGAAIGTSRAATGAPGGPPGAPAAAPAAARAPSRVTGQAPEKAAAEAGALEAGALSTPAPPAGVGAPPLSAATKLIPSDADAEQRAAGASQRELDPPIEATAIGSPPPATAAAGGNGVAADPLAPAPPADRMGRPAAERMPRPAAAGSGTAQGPSRAQLGSSGSGARRPGIPPRGPAPSEDGARRRFMVLIGALAAVAVVAVLLIVTSGGTGSQSSSSASRTSNAPAGHPRRAPAFNPASVTVAVLNGTATPQLAHKVSLQLGGQGYKEGTIATAADQTATSTVVAYMPGHRHDAVEVASALKLGPASVQPVDSSTQAVACPPPAACSATVVVTVGSDLASQ